MNVMKITSGILMLLLITFCFVSCEKETNANEVALEGEILDVDFEKLIEQNMDEDMLTINLSPSEFKDVLKLATGTSDVNSYFEDEQIRKTFRQKTIEALNERSDYSRNYCNGFNYFAEAYSGQQGYSFDIDNSFAYARRFGTSSLWAAAFDCNTLNEVYKYYGNCSYSSGCCMVRALYYSGGGNVNLFGISPSYCN